MKVVQYVSQVVVGYGVLVDTVHVYMYISFSRPVVVESNGSYLLWESDEYSNHYITFLG